MNTTQAKPAPIVTLLRGGRIEGELPVVTFGPIDHLAEEDIKEIEYATFLHEQLGREDEAKGIIAALEQRLGVTAADKAAAFGPQEPWEGDLLAALGYAPPEEGAAALVRDYRRLNEAEEKALEAAAKELARAKTQGNKELAKGKIARIGERLHQRVELKERHAGIQETIGLEKARGGEVDEKPAGGGAAHMISRDALGHMLKLGHITRAQYAAGLAYRRAFEARGADLQASQISDTGGGKGHDNDAFVARKLEQAKEADFAKTCEVAVRKYCSVEHLSALQMLQWVAGMGRSMRDFGKGGRAYERNKAALCRALDLVQAIAAEQRKQPQDAA